MNNKIHALASKRCSESSKLRHRKLGHSQQDCPNYIVGFHGKWIEITWLTTAGYFRATISQQLALLPQAVRLQP
jgi:hypothetical protein